MRKLILAVTVIAVAVNIAACSFSKTPITADDFTNKLEALDYTIEDVTDQLDDEQFESILIATDLSDSYQIEFYQFSSTTNARSLYLANQEKLDIGDSAITTNVSGTNFAQYSKTAGGTYSYLAYIDNTFICLNLDAEYKKEVQEVMKSLGY
jgi:hypothetical protein